jgi:TrbL/VirB6 plasmid conjugal transfer protein
MRRQRRHSGQPARRRPPSGWLRGSRPRYQRVSAGSGTGGRGSGRRGRRVRRVAVVLGVLAVLLLLLGRAGQPGGTAQAAPAAHSASGQPVAAVTTAARQPATSGGLCSVPGIGDIGSLVNLCSLGSSGLIGDLNNVCQPSLPDPEAANSGINTLISPPAQGKQPATLYGSYGVAGQYWAATNLQCSDMTSLIGNNVAGMVFDIAKSIDRVTITVYQAAAGNGILNWLTSVVNKLISAIGNAIYFPYLAPVVIIGTMWLAWQGLIRKRATRTIEGTIWMVVACAAAIWLIGRPADFTGMGAGVSNDISGALNTAFAKLPAPSQSGCLPVTSSDPQAPPTSYGSGSAVVAENANDLWTVLVCKPWLAGEFGTTAYSSPGSPPTVVNTYGRQLLWAQAIATNEKPTSALIQAKQSTYAGISASIQQNDPSVYPLFQGKDWTTRLEIGFAALFAAAIAGVLVLLISVTLILLKLGFLLLLITGPFFLLVGTHPGYGRVIAVRWFEMLVGVLLKQMAVALVLSVLLYAYSLIMGTSDTVLPWGLKILMISLVTIAVFIYRRPFQHLFSAVGYGMIGSTARADTEVERIRPSMPSSRLAAAAAALPALANYRAALLSRRTSAGLAAAASAGVQSGAAAGTAAGNGQAGDGNGAAAASEGASAAGRSGLASRARDAVSAGNGQARSAPPLNLPPRDGQAAGGPARAGRPAPGSSLAGTTPAGPPRAGSAVTGAARASAGGAAGPSQPPPSSGQAAPGRPGWPLRPGLSPRSAPARPDPAPGPRGGNGSGGPWADTSPGRAPGPPVRQPATPAAPAAPARPSAPARPAAQPSRGDGPSRGSADGAGPPGPGTRRARPPDGPSWLRPRRRK